jgi:manganese efflux pump family protein
MRYSAAVTLGLGLSLDAFAAALEQGAILALQQRLPHAFVVGLAFGVAQGLMPLIGWRLGVAFQDAFQLGLTQPGRLVILTPHSHPAF